MIVDEPLLLVVDNKNDSYEIEGSMVFGIYSNIETTLILIHIWESLVSNEKIFRTKNLVYKFDESKNELKIER